MKTKYEIVEEDEEENFENKITLDVIEAENDYNACICIAYLQLNKKK
jgi:hypothetical protein